MAANFNNGNNNAFQSQQAIPQDVPQSMFQESELSEEITGSSSLAMDTQSDGNNSTSMQSTPRNSNSLSPTTTDNSVNGTTSQLTIMSGAPGSSTSTKMEGLQENANKAYADSSKSIQTVMAPDYTANSLNHSKVQWGVNCTFSQYYKFLTSKDTPMCGSADRAHETCNSCQTIPPFFFRIEFTREIPSSDVSKLGSLIHQSFPLPNGARLLVFTTEEEAQKSPWANNSYTNGNFYIRTNNSGQKAVAFHCCLNSNKMEILCTPIITSEFACNQILKKHLAKLNSKNSVQKEPEKKEMQEGADIKDKKERGEKQKQTPHSRNKSSRAHNAPEPHRFIFNENTFPVNVTLPAGVLTYRNSTGELNQYSDEEIVCYFDDVVMPFSVQDGLVVIEVRKNPFEKLYRPKEYDNLAITVAVYKKGSNVPVPGLNLQAPSNANNSASVTKTTTTVETKVVQEQSAQVQQETVQEKLKRIQENIEKLKSRNLDYHLKPRSAKGDMIYKGTFRFYMRTPDNDAASDSDSDTEEQTIPKGVVAKKRYHMGDHLQLSLPFHIADKFYTLIQSYLRGGFVASEDPKVRIEAKARRNVLFTQIMNQDCETARVYIAGVLAEVGKYYIENCQKAPDFMNGILTLLEYCHSLGVYGGKSLLSILFNSPFKPKENQSVQFKFSKLVGRGILPVYMVVNYKGDIFDTMDEKEAAKAASELFTVDDLNDSFKKLNVADDGSDTIQIVSSSNTQASFMPIFQGATGLHSTNPALNTTNMETKINADVKGKKEQENSNDLLVNPRLKLHRVTGKSSMTQASSFWEVLDSHPNLKKYSPEEFKTALGNLFKLAIHREVSIAKALEQVTSNSPQKIFFFAAMKCVLALWPEVLKSESEMNQTLAEEQFVKIVNDFMNSDKYMAFGLNYTNGLYVSQLQKLFRLYTGDLAVGNIYSKDAVHAPMDIIAFLQTIMLFLMPNDLIQSSHPYLSLQEPRDLGNAIDVIFDALTDPKGGDCLPLYQGPLSLSSSEKLLEKPVEHSNLPNCLLRLADIDIKDDIAHGINLVFIWKNKNVNQLPLCMEKTTENGVIKPCLINKDGKPAAGFGSWLKELMKVDLKDSIEPSNAVEIETENSDAEKSKRTNRARKRFKGAN